ncbi:MAG: TetR family transcriptional regulator [Phycisphaerae bacterium]|jgi:AcrR family transcriptional regulator
MALKSSDYQTKSGDSTHGPTDRLLDAAERLFCERGFEGTSVRDLTKAADCNVAAVNYHFGNKENLYEQMFRRHLNEVFEEHQENIERVMNGQEKNLERFLEFLVRTALVKLTAADSQIPLMKLVVREILNPQLKQKLVALDIAKEFLEKISECLQKLVPQLDKKLATMCTFSIQGMLLHPMLFFDLYNKLFWEMDIDELTGQTVKFAAAGIRNAARE